MVVFSVLGTVEGFAEETPGFDGLLVPMMLALGYDRLVAVGTSTPTSASSGRCWSCCWC